MPFVNVHGGGLSSFAFLHHLARDDEFIGFGDLEGGADEAFDIDRIGGEACALFGQLPVERFQMLQPSLHRIPFPTDVDEIPQQRATRHHDGETDDEP